MEFLAKIIKKVIFEAMATSHFKERVFDRLKSEYTNFIEEKQEIKDLIYKNISLLEDVTFPGQDNIGVLIWKGSKLYRYNTVKDGKQENTEGNFIWVVIRGNDMETIIFGDNNYKPKNTQIWLTIEKLENYIKIEKGGDSVLTEKDLRKIQNWKPNAEKIEVKKDNVLNINGVKYGIDKDNNVIFKKNKPSDRLNIDDIFDSLPERTQQELLSYL